MGRRTSRASRSSGAFVQTSVSINCDTSVPILPSIAARTIETATDSARKAAAPITTQSHQLTMICVSLLTWTLLLARRAAGASSACSY
jgi:hypothetical protein